VTRKTIFWLTIAIMLLATSKVASAPAYLRVIPVSGTVIDLYWSAMEGESYDIWATTDGVNWSKIFTTGQGANSFFVTEGIQPYRNYYFLVAVAGTILSNPLTEANSVNSTEIGVGYPPNQHVHNYYLADTNLCANCHRTHRAQGASLLKFPTVEETCLTCHDGTQSKYNVLDGQVSRDGTWMNPLASSAGPFGSLMGKISSSRPVAAHTIGTPLNQAPGGNPVGVEEWEQRLSCVSCHTAHFSTNFRILTSNTPANPVVEVRAFADSTGDQEREKINYIKGMNTLCSGCHPDYHAQSGAGSEPAAGTHQSDGLFRHPVGVRPADFGNGLTTSLPLEGLNRDNRDNISCITCHRAHGSTSLSHIAEQEQGGARQTNYLLRKDYYGVCQDCHKR